MWQGLVVRAQSKSKMRVARGMGLGSGSVLAGRAVIGRQFFSSESGDGGNSDKRATIMHRRVFNQTLETPHQRAFGQEAYLEEVTDDSLMITGWGIGQFKVNNFQVTGPIILTKKNIFRWKLDKAHPTVHDLKVEDFELFRMMKPAVDLILLGTGNNIQYPPKDFLKQLREIAPIEILDSVNAGATFNLLTKEDRQVAAALLPVQEWAS